MLADFFNADHLHPSVYHRKDQTMEFIQIEGPLPGALS
jgi:hypothetical protein